MDIELDMGALLSKKIHLRVLKFRAERQTLGSVFAVDESSEHPHFPPCEKQSYSEVDWSSFAPGERQIPDRERDSGHHLEFLVSGSQLPPLQVGY